MYSDLAIQISLTLKTLFRLTCRASEGLMKSQMCLTGLDLSVPDHTPHVASNCITAGEDCVPPGQGSRACLNRLNRPKGLR
ncbi:hypothetical protein GWK36_12705 [Caldichromatium japonicum]|uniref:Transposase DDE domain-containing protein n=1 Tax=Caldichromatium japonicum TaxID=2699430 RepID=A0A6G7VF80_9GAMM|nr:hypothetical protein GWK36_12705 [Caldichromatium japonicum]